MKISTITLNRVDDGDLTLCTLSPQTIELFLALLQHLERYRYIDDWEDLFHIIDSAWQELDPSSSKLYFLEQARDTGTVSGSLSRSTVYLAMQGLELAYDRDRWQVGVDDLDDTEFDESQDILTTAIDELSALV